MWCLRAFLWAIAGNPCFDGGFGTGAGGEGNQVFDVLQHGLANVIQGEVVGIATEGVFNFFSNFFDAKQGKRNQGHDGASPPAHCAHHLEGKGEAVDQ